MTIRCRIAAVILVGLLIAVSWLTLTGRLAAFDRAIIRFIYRWRSPGLTPAMVAISVLGNQALYGAAVGIGAFLVARKQWSSLGRCALLLGGQELINTLSKALIARPRPDYLPLAHETSYSFPSGHSMAAVVFYGALAYWLHRKHYGGRHSNRAWFALAALIALLVGISRIYLGVHYPTDVLGGYLIGALWLLIVLSLSPVTPAAT